jgi:hypothetical protein
VEAPDVRDAPSRYLNFDRRLRRRRALAALRDVATDEQLIVLTADVRSLIRRLADAPEHVPPILLVCLAGRVFLNDGHHRLIASRLLGVPVTADVPGLPDPDPASAGQP